jgi:two-component system chemotaxis sensor kinase CheA
MSSTNLQFDVAELLETFYAEAEEHLASFERGLLELESAPTNADVIARVFRAAHSLKGGSGIVGLTAVADFTHALEGVLDRLRSGSIVYESTLAGHLLESLDVLKALIEASRGGPPAPPNWPALRAKLEQLAQQGKPSATGERAAPPSPSKPESASSERRFEIRFVPAADMLESGMDPLLLVRDVTGAGQVEVLELDSSRLPALADLEPESCFLGWRIVLRTAQSEADLREVFAFAEDRCQLSIQEAKNVAPAAEAAAPEQHPEPQVEAHHEAHAETQSAPPPRNAAAATASGQSIRVATEKLDKLLDLVGELVIAQSMIVEALRSHASQEDTRLGEALGAMDRNTRELQEGVMAIRMVPLATVFRRFPRLVRDLALSSGKKIRLQIEGEGTEIDKGMVEQLVDPLTHLVRNAIDHGIEPPEQRRAVGKSEEGVITIHALHQGGSVVIVVSDDGRGLATDKIRAKAVKRGLIEEGAALTDSEVHELIFHPGFSTAEKVTDVSGRGVGMDVVKRNVEGLNGSVSFTTELGRGMQMKLRLPLTLAILDGLSVRVGQQVFILPIFSVVESFRPKPDQVRGVFGMRDVIDVRGASMPIVRLYELLGVPDAEEDPCAALVCIVEANGSSVALLVDEVIGQPQVVVKSLEANYRRIDAVMGATILGDGRVAMILDVQSLSRGAGAGTPDKQTRRAAAPTESSWIH